ncbi:unnamed protein product [Cuscuta campestris]|uniref:Integrase catalytic domain-containing protein n=1 Tax=Cuscuta campestris TaxID=132261 RepID=A0A484MPJ0_9ASTE|nr:unnamed protein product [Cuscuta campestris]VFQ89844.1 unnamed protein product [Cuscuta campestris]
MTSADSAPSFIRISAAKHFPIKLTKTNYLVWRHQDAILLSALLGSCTDAVQPVISLAETSANVWSRLAASLTNMSRGHIISLKSQLAKNPRRNRTIEAFIADMTTIASNLALAGSLVTDEDLAVHIMSQLGDEYSSVYQSLRGRNDDISLDELSTILKDCEREIHDHSAALFDLVPAANHAQRMRGSDHRGCTFGRGGQSGASRSGMRGRGSSNPTRGGRYCQFCDYPGHDTKFCHKLQRFLKEHNVSIGSAPLATPTAHMTVSPGGCDESESPWIIDSGASHHVVGDPSSLTTLMDYGGPDEGWEDISMDFIIGLPPSRGFTVIMVIMDRLSKMVHLGTLLIGFDAHQTTHLFIDIVVKLHGFHKTILSDRDQIFLSNFWQETLKASGTTLKLNMALYPQTDGQTEVMNRAVEQNLRAFLQGTPTWWTLLLPWDEYALNTNVHAGLDMTPFEAVFG